MVSPVIAPGQTNGEMKEEDVDNITLCTIHHRQKDGKLASSAI